MCAAIAGGLTKVKLHQMKNQSTTAQNNQQKFEKRKVIFYYMDDIWGVDLEDMQFISR